MNAAALLLIALVGAHLLLDYAGQGDFMSRAKSPLQGVPGIPWRVILWSHAAIHGAAVALITGVWWLFVLETIAHAWLDRAKCRGRITFTQDQAGHLGCKLAWWLVAVWLA